MPKRIRRRLGRAGTPSVATVALFGVAALAVLQFYDPPASLLASSRLPIAHLDSADVEAEPSPNAYGLSGQVKIRFALPGSYIQYPLEVRGDPSFLGYAWAPVHEGRIVDTTATEPPRPLAGADLVAPDHPGFYRLTVTRPGQPRQVVEGMTLAVMVPFGKKLGSTLNGYRIGTYLSERLGGRHERPEGFVEVTQDQLDLPLTKHLRLADFLTHDGQQTWPRYAALDARLLDKLELVFQEIARWQGGDDQVQLDPDVHSGFRTPSHNRRVRRAAGDSRHQYGDAADVAIDANGDGRVDATDAKLVALAAEIVEDQHPDLVGGLGLYTRNGSPYVHIDTRGKRARWRG
jgi:uncharacterized protein YcbK (DUF882 family)